MNLYSLGTCTLFTPADTLNTRSTHSTCFDEKTNMII